jgi:hypothetical protein
MEVRFSIVGQKKEPLFSFIDSLDHLRLLAEMGNSDGDVHWGVCLEYVIPVERDVEAAVRLSKGLIEETAGASDLRGVRERNHTECSRSTGVFRDGRR